MKLNKLVTSSIVALCLFAGISSATEYVESPLSSIQSVRYHTKDVSYNGVGVWNGNYWFSINKTIAGCPQYLGGTLIAVTPSDKEVISMVLTAKAAEQQVKVTVDKTNLIAGYCRMTFLTL